MAADSKTKKTGAKKQPAKNTPKKNDGKNSKKQTGGSSSSKNRQSSSVKKNTQQERETASFMQGRNQIAAIIIFASAFLLFFVGIINGAEGTVWNALRGITFGFLGYNTFVIPVMLIYIAVIMTMDKLENNIVIKIFEGLLLLTFISSFVYIFRHSEDIYFADDIKNEFMLYFNEGSTGCGVFGAFFGELLLIIGRKKAPAYVILSLFIFVSFMFFTGFTLIRLFRMIINPVKKVGEITQQKYAKNAEMKFSDSTESVTRRRKIFTVYDESALDDDEKDAQKKKEKEKNYEIKDFDENGSMPVIESDEIKDIFSLPPKEEKIESIDFNEEKTDSDVQSIFTIPTEIGNGSDKKEKVKEKISDSEVESVKLEINNEITDLKPESDDNYMLPSVEILNKPAKNARAASQADLKATADKLIGALKSFNVSAQITEIVPGPSVTRYEVAPAPGVKISKFTGLADDLALHLAAPAGVRIEAPIPNKSAIGIEVPNRGRTTVTMREIVSSDVYENAKSKLNVALGKDIAGNVVCCDIAKMPHLLIAGTTGSGKSVCLNAMIVSILYNAKPSEVKILLIDPKQVEFSVYNGIPHLLVPVVSDARKAAGALAWAVTEMLNRYKTLQENGVRDIGAYNSLCDEQDNLEKMPQVVIVIDELSDLMSVAPSEVEDSITRLAQMARAAGMHLVVATQRPSVDVITGLIKANIPSRIALSVSSQIDSRTIIDTSGAEKLLGLGDMLYYPVGMSKPKRVQGCFLSDAEIERVVEFVKSQESTVYDDAVQQEIEKNALSTAKKGSKDSSSTDGGNVSDADMQIINKAALLVIENPEKASISAFQRNLSLGFSKAGRIMDELENRGVVGPSAGSKPRKVLMSKAQWYEMNAMNGGEADNENEEKKDE